MYIPFYSKRYERFIEAIVPSESVPFNEEIKIMLQIQTGDDVLSLTDLKGSIISDDFEYGMLVALTDTKRLHGSSLA